MTEKKHTYQLALALALVLALALAVGCQTDDDEAVTGQSEVPIAFAGNVNDDAATRAGGTPLYYYQKSIKLMGTKTFRNYKNTADSSATVFPFYRLQYKESTETWEYVSTEHDSLKNTGQIPKYWDTDALKYYFVAGAPYFAVSMNYTERAFQLSGLSSEGATGTSGTINTAYLFTYPTEVVLTDSMKAKIKAGTVDPVMLTFRLAMCRIKVGFKFATEQTEDVNLTGITFGPTGDGTYISKGNLLIKDNPSDASVPLYATQGTKTTNIDLGYRNLTIGKGAASTAVTYATPIYYLIPQTNTGWTLTIPSLSGHNTATVPMENLDWKPGHEYIYIFELSSVKTDPTIKFINCVQTAITDWIEGSSSEANLYNW